MEPITYTLTHVKSTKGTHVFETEDPQVPVRSVYVQKYALPQVPPSGKIELTIKPVK